MKRRTEIRDIEKHLTKKPIEKDNFYERWYAKFGKPQKRTLPGDKFMERLKEMIEFE